MIDKQSLEKWLHISKENGGYVSNELIPPDQIRQAGLTEKPNFGYILDDPNFRYGRLSLAEDIACVFEKILSSLYRVIHLNENSEAVISDLLRETPGETGLHKKYLIACESLIGWYEENSDQRKILREFIKIIKDAIKEAQGATNGQSIQTIKDTIKAKGTANGQSIQTNQGAIKRQETTDGQETPLKSLMRRLDKIRELGRKGPS